MARAFSLIETLVTITVIAVLISILLPVLASVRGRADDISRLSSVSQLSKAAIAYTNDWADLFPYYKATPGDPGAGVALERSEPERASFYSYFTGLATGWVNALAIPRPRLLELTLAQSPQEQIDRETAALERGDDLFSLVLMSHTTASVPEVWNADDPNLSDRAFVPMRLSDAVFPSSKALLVDYITTDPAGPPRTHALMDGSARDAPVTKVDGLLTPHGALPARGLVTHDGIRGRDF